MNFMYCLQEPLSYIIRPIYNLIGNYGITLIVVTILIRLITIPLTVMSQKNMSRTQLIQPEVIKLQNKYKNDRDTLAREMNKLYQKYGMSPFSGCTGCFPLIIQMFVLFGFIGVIYNPLECILQLDNEKIDVLAKLAGAKAGTQDVNFCGHPAVIDQLVKWNETPIEFDLLGINLALIPNKNSSIVEWIFPALAFIATVVSSFITRKQSQNNSSGNEQTQSMSNMMLFLMPVMTLFFVFMMPIAMSLYWFVSTTLQIVQQTVITKVINKKVKAELELKGNFKNDNNRKIR